jgi:hypothetical protein
MRVGFIFRGGMGLGDVNEGFACRHQQSKIHRYVDQQEWLPQGNLILYL